MDVAKSEHERCEKNPWVKGKA